MLQERQEQKGSLVIEVRERSGIVARKVAAKNQIVSGGRLLVANLFRGHEKKPVTHIALGSGSRPVSAADAALESELAPRKAFDATEVETESYSTAILQADDGRPALRAFALEPGGRGDEVRVHVGRAGRLLSANVESPGAREELGEFRLEEAGNLRSRLIRFETLGKELPAETAVPVALAGGRDVSARLSATFGFDDCNGRVGEAGLFNAPEGGVMYNRVVFPEIHKTSSLSLTIAWKITF